MSNHDADDLLTGPHSLGAPREIDLETLLAASHLIGHLATRVRSLAMEDIKRWDRVLSGGVFHDAQLESLIDRDNVTDDELRADLEGRVLRLLDRLREINQQTGS